VKIRGYRIELSEIESVLREHAQVHQAVVNVFERSGLKELAAYVVTPCVNGSFDRDDVLQWLRSRLPAYMIPSYLDVIGQIPMLASGKADRSSLPEPKTPLVSTSRSVVPASNALEQQIHDVWVSLFNVSQVSCDDDFFLDLGGYSLLAANLVSLLRSEHGLDVAIRDVYLHPTVQKLAAHVGTQIGESKPAPAAESSKPKSSREVFNRSSRWQRYACYTLQLFSSVLMYGAVTAPMLAAQLSVLYAMQGTITLGLMTIWIIMLIFLVTPVAIISSIVTKWLVIGRYKPGEYPLWSLYYFRWWLVTRVQGLSGVDLYAGTPLMSLYYRLMGAKLGRNCIIDTPMGAIFDLVSIGSNTCIGAETQLLGYRVEDGMLKIGRIEIGSRCFVGTHCCLGINTRMEDDSYLEDLSLLPDGALIPSGEARRGSPAQPAVISLPSVPEEPRRRHPFLFGLLFFVAGEIIGELVLLSAVPPLVIAIATYLYFGLAWAVASVFLSIPLGVVSFCLIVAIAKACILRRSTPGVYPVESWYFLRKWSADSLLTSTGHLVSILCTTIYLPAWLRMLGARIGRRAEISTVTIMTPDLMVIADESFLADGSMVGGRRFFRGHVQVGVNHIGRRSFVGNNAILPIGANLGDDSLLGVLSVVPGGVGSTTSEGSEWLGSPPFQLPYRKKVEGFDISGTFEPTFRLYVVRCLIDAIRIVLPIAIGVAAALGFIAWVAAAFAYLPVWALLSLNPIVATGIAIIAALSAVVVKRMLMGTFKPVIKPLWCTYVWFNEVVNGVYENVGLPIMELFMGTPFFNWYMRLMGCKVGKHVFLETGLFSEFDLVEIGDYAALNYGAVAQNHLFEDRIMKSSYLKIGDGCSVGNMSIVLYDSEMQTGSSIDSLSLLMKGETLPPHTKWVGIPTNQVR
jgi:non-ribosomal peptide synthetase-like protein